jgi:hypothetical protein
MQPRQELVRGAWLVFGEGPSASAVRTASGAESRPLVVRSGPECAMRHEDGAICGDRCRYLRDAHR